MIALALALVFLVTSSCSNLSKDWEYVGKPHDISNVGTGTFYIPAEPDRIK